MFIRISLSFIIFTLLAWQLLIMFVDNDLQGQQHSKSPVYSSCEKIWSARGYYENKAEQNSMTAFQRAFDFGAKGAEIDFYYDVQSNRFIVSHGKPKKNKQGALVYQKKEGRLLTLEYVFLNTSPEHYFWLDYKNLDRLDELQTQAAIKRLQEVSKKTGFTKQLYIEGSNPLILSKYTAAGFNTILGIHPLPQSNWLSSLSISIYKLAYYFNDITALAMPYGDINNPIFDDEAELALFSIPLFLFHVPVESGLIQNLLTKTDVKAFLVGRDKSVNFFEMSNCSQ